jgi:hypothetical protein
MNFDTNSKTTDIIMFNSRNLGALIVDEQPHVREWDEPQFGIQNIGIEESYGFGVLNEGQAIAPSESAGTRDRRRQADGPLGGFGRRGLRGTARSGRRGPDRRQRGAFRTISGLSEPRRARLPSSQIVAAPDPEQRSEAPAGRGVSSSQRPVLEAPGSLGLAG